VFVLRKKLDGKAGFTLIEMLIVVAIIAILVAVSIPLVSSALERTRMATDASNERAAKAEAVILYLSENISKASKDSDDNDTTNAYLYDAASGKLVFSGGATPTGGPYKTYGQCADHKGMYLWVQVLEDGTVRLVWLEGLGGTYGEAWKWNENLCGSKIQSGS